MLASPLIQAPTSPALVRRSDSRPSTRPTTKSPSRVLALRLDAHEGRPPRKMPISYAKIAEAFLKFSPRVHVRNTADAGVFWLFLDIASTSHLFFGEESLISSASSLARELGFGVKSAVADTPAGAQAFAIHQSLCPPGEEKDRLKHLSLPLLLQLEGLEAWAKPTTVESIITFFMMLGFKNIGDLSRFTMASFQERWGEVGVSLWKRLNAQERSVISPLIPIEPLEDYLHLDFPVSLVSLLLHEVSKSTDLLFARLSARRQLVQTLTLILHCEYGKAQHKIEIEPNVPSRDTELFATLIENRLSALELENPVRDFEIHIVPAPEKSQQFDFFEPRTTAGDKLQMLMSLLTQSSLKIGHYEIAPSIVPEKSWRVVNHVRAPQSLYQGSDRQEALMSSQTSSVKAITSGAQAVTPQPHYGAAVMNAPRPTRILQAPLPLTIEDIQEMRILSTTPIERLEAHWWASDNEAMTRDYYFAVSPTGQCLWIYQDLKSEEYFLHGYFD